MRRWRTSLALLVCLTLLAVAPITAAAAKDGRGAEQAPQVDLQILAFNDFHGQIEPYSPTLGGAEYLATWLRQYEATNPNTLIVSGGDMIGASPLVSALFHDEPTIEAANLMGVDIAVVGNVLGAIGDNEVESSPALALEEAEASFQAVIDPYARADFFFAFGPEGVEIEEGFITFNSLPGGLLLKAGKMRAAFGRVNTMHVHTLPWTDRPLMTQNLLGGRRGKLTTKGTFTLIVKKSTRHEDELAWVGPGPE